MIAEANTDMRTGHTMYFVIDEYMPLFIIKH